MIINSPNEKHSSKDEGFRNFALNGPMWNVVLYVGFPLALYQCTNQIFKILDTLMASHINAVTASTIVYLSQLSLVLNALGNGLSIGASLKISEAYGAGDYDLVQKRVNGLFTLCVLLSLSILIITIPFMDSILRFAKTPDAFIRIGAPYFIIELCSTVFIFFNHIYISIERIRGNSKRILYLNLCAMLTKLGLTAFFVYVLDKGITMIAVATLFSQLIITITALYHLTRKESAFRLSRKYIALERKVILPMIRLSLPVSLEKSIFSFGKAIVNSMVTLYEPLTVGALGISDHITGINVVPQNGFRDGAASIISQNLGAGNIKRGLEAFKAVLFINIITSILLLIPSLLFAAPITGLFAKNDSHFHALLLFIFYYDLFSTLPLGIHASVLALFYGFGRTKIALLLNICRIFLFRIPLLWIFQTYTTIGIKGIGIALVASNVLIGSFALGFAALFIKNICKKNHLSFWKNN